PIPQGVRGCDLLRRPARRPRRSGDRDSLARGSVAPALGVAAVLAPGPRPAQHPRRPACRGDPASPSCTTLRLVPRRWFLERLIYRQRPHRDSNSGYRRERAVSWASRRWGRPHSPSTAVARDPREPRRTYFLAAASSFAAFASLRPFPNTHAPRTPSS